IEQKYGYVPALLNVKENFSSVSSTLDLNAFGSSVLTTVWGISSRLVHVTLVPTGTVSVAGPKLKLSIFTSAVAGFSWALARIFFWPTVIVPTPVASATVRIAIDTLVLMFFFLSFNFADQIGLVTCAISASSERRIFQLACHGSYSAFEHTNIRNHFLSPFPGNLLGRAARVRESREPAPRMGRVSPIQTTKCLQIFPLRPLTNHLLY